MAKLRYLYFGAMAAQDVLQGWDEASGVDGAVIKKLRPFGGDGIPESERWAWDSPKVFFDFPPDYPDDYLCEHLRQNPDFVRMAAEWAPRFHAFGVWIAWDRAGCPGLALSAELLSLLAASGMTLELDVVP